MSEVFKLILVFALALLALKETREKEDVLAYATELEIYMEENGMEVPDSETLRECAEEWEKRKEDDLQARDGN